MRLRAASAGEGEGDGGQTSDWGTGDRPVEQKHSKNNAVKGQSRGKVALQHIFLAFKEVKNFLGLSKQIPFKSLHQAPHNHNYHILSK